jgi:hypothetical protein
MMAEVARVAGQRLALGKSVMRRSRTSMGLEIRGFAWWADLPGRKRRLVRLVLMRTEQR